MTFLVALLFIHVLAALGFAISLGLEWVVAIQLRRAAVAAEVRQVMKIARRLPATGAPSMLLVLATGLTMAGIHNLWGEWWIIFSLVARGVLIAIGAGMTAPGSLALQRAVASRLEASGPAQALEGLQLENRITALALRLKTMLLVGLVFLMTAHPDWPGSLASVAACLAIGLLWSLLD